MIATLAATAAAAAADAIVYAAVALILWRKPATAEGRTALRAFAGYWGLTATYQALSSIQHALASVGIAPFSFELFARLTGLALAAAGLASLLCFFAYLKRGDRAWFPWIAGLYAASAVLTWVHVARSRPTGVAITPWSVDLAYANDFNSGLFLPLLLVLLVIPIAAAAWYATLLRRAQDARQRYRILAVAAGVGIQLLSFLVARIARSPGWELVSRLLVGLLVAALVLSAYARAPAQPSDAAMHTRA